jgi:hypothetical protein
MGYELDLFNLMVNSVAGSIALSLVIWGLIILVTCIMGRMSMKSIIVLLAVYTSVSTIGYVGALASIPIFLVALWYMVTGIINYFNSMR